MHNEGVASIDPGCSGGPVPGSAATAPTRIGGLTLFPRTHTVLLHDWTVVAHEFGWSRAEADEAVARRLGFVEELKAIAARLERDGGEFFTYETAPPSLIRGRCPWMTASGTPHPFLSAVSAARGRPGLRNRLERARSSNT